MAPIILHTTGTVSGMHKPVPQTDRAMNSFVLAAMEAKDNFEDFKKAPEHMVTYLPMYLSWAYVLVDMVHTSLSLGIEIVSLPMAATNPRYSEALEHYGVNVLFTSNNFLDTWLKTRPDIDLSKLKIVIMGGTYVSPEYKKEFNDYLRSCGSTARVINGYGLSEMGGACTIAPSSREDDAIGYLLPGFKAKIYVEDEGRCYDISDGPRTGILWLSSPTMSSGKLDDTVFFELEDVDGEEYFNSHDLVRVNKDSSLTCIGRSNHYFVNNAGVRFDAGQVETAVTSQPGIKACGLAPEFHKMLHDNVPVLYVEMTDPGLSDLGTLRQALVQVFMNDGLISDTNLPSQCVIVEHIPLNSSGKVDAKKLASGTVVGDRYSVKSIYTGDKMMDILLIPAAEGEFATMGAGIPQEFKGDPYNILSEIFALIPEINRGHFLKVFNISGIRELILKLTDFDIENIPLSLWNMVPKLLTMAYRDNLMPYLNGGKNMSRGKKTDNEFMAIFGKVQVPPMPPFMAKDGKTEWPDASKVKKDTNDFMDNCDSNMMTFWNQMIELQKSQIQSTRDQWMQFFDQLLEMQDTFAKNLPEELPVPPGFPAFPISPRYMMEQLKKYEEMSNDHFTEQADSLADFCIKSQEQSREVANTVVDKASDIRNDEETPAPAKKKTTKAKAAEPEPAKAKETKPKAKSTNTKKKTTKAKAAEPEPAKDNTEIVL